MSAKKRTRILTNRDFPGSEGAFEFIEMEVYNGQEYLYWRFGETIVDADGHKVTGEGCFPISVDLVQERFAELGREYRPSGKERCKTVEDLIIK